LTVVVQPLMIFSYAARAFSRVSARAMSTTPTPLVVAPVHLRHLVPMGNVSILDASWFMPNSERSAPDEFVAKHIPNSQYLDLDAVASPHELGLKHMMPDGHVFADACGMCPSVTS
jgi:thiosulfate/3-mercaptopyruvate sulfurtransferase